jgi:hypothetical protein
MLSKKLPELMAIKLKKYIKNANSWEKEALLIAMLQKTFRQKRKQLQKLLKNNYFLPKKRN